MPDYSKIPQADFDRILGDLMDDAPASHLLTIPGIYEILAEHYNNEILDAWTEEQEEEDEGTPIEYFIKEHRKEIDSFIYAACDNANIEDDDDREQWILNEEYLYNWARREGVKI